MVTPIFTYFGNRSLTKNLALYILSKMKKIMLHPTYIKIEKTTKIFLEKIGSTVKEKNDNNPIVIAVSKKENSSHIGSWLLILNNEII